jgi:peptidoglycan/LPS O-acetylase OafA/YrhL
VFSFFAGIGLYRLRDRAPTVSPWLVVALMVLMFAAAPPAAWRWLSDSALVLFGLPLVVWLGGATEPKGAARPAFHVSGAISYAIYALHLPILGVIGMLAFHLHAGLGLGVGLGMVLALVLCAWLADRFYDTPLRARVTAALRPTTTNPAPG